MKLKDGFVVRKVADAWVVVPIGSRVIDFNGLVSLNETGAFIWKQLEQNVTIDSIVASLCNEFEIDEKTAMQDCREFIHVLDEKNLIIQKNS